MYRVAMCLLAVVGSSWRLTAPAYVAFLGSLRPCGDPWKYQGCFAITGGGSGVCVGPHNFIPAPNVFRVQLIYTLFSQRMENVLHIKSGGGLLVADVNRIEAVLTSWWNVTMRPQVANNVSLVLVVYDALDVKDGAHWEFTTGWTQAGSSGAAATNSILTSKIKFSTGFAGRSFRGGVFIPSFPGSVFTSGVLTTAYRDAVVAAWNTLRTSLAAGGDQLCVVSYCNAKTWRTTAVVTPVTSCSGHTTINRQGRRAVPGA